MTKREAILQAIKTKLETISGVAVYRSKVEALARHQVPAAIVEPIGDAPDINVFPYIDWALLVRVTVFVRGDVPDQIADPIVMSVHSKMTEDLFLGGLSMDIRPQNVSFDLLEGDKPVGIVTLDFTVQYRTAYTSLSV